MRPATAPASAPVPQKNVAAHRAADRAAGILRHHEAPERAILPGGIGIGCRALQPDRHGHRHETSVDRERAPGGERHLLGAHRAIRRLLLLEPAEEDVGRVLVHDLGRPLGVCCQPVPNRRHRHVLTVERAEIDQPPADREVVVPVGGGVGETAGRTVLESDPAGALDVQKEGVDGVVHPDQLQPLCRKRAAVDFGPGRIGLQRAVGHPPGDPLAGERGPEQAEIDRHQIGRAAVKGHAIAPAGLRGAAQLRLEVAGEEAGGLCAVPRLIRREVRFEESAGLVCALQPGGCADRAPVADAPAQRCDI